MKNSWHIVIVLMTLSTLLGPYAYAQRSVGIGTSEPNQHALLHLVSAENNQGLLLPQLTTAQRESIMASSPDDDGLLVYDTELKTFFYWHTDKWNPVAQSADNASNDSDNDPTNELELPDQTGQEGKVLMTDGIEVSWEGLIDPLPDQTGQSGKYLMTDGTSASWQIVSANGASTISLTDIESGGATTGQILTWNGSAWVPVTSSGAGPHESYHSIDPTGFAPVYSSTGDPSRNNLILFEESGNIIASVFNRAEGETISAPVKLPHQAEIQSITIYCLDRRGPDLQVQFVSKAFGAGTTVLGSVSSSGNSPDPQQLVIDGPFIINNQNSSYSIRAIFDIGGATSNDLSDIRHGIYGVTIKYIQP